ncbi:hypothetical protein O3G_MSEX001173 (mitochondrion) [Manduca sexta]|nr:hypothetical protein O3G_MSEX001173 [Manduca sexta]
MADYMYEYSDFHNIEFDSYMIPSNDLNNNNFRLLDVDNRIILPMNNQIRIMVTATDMTESKYWSLKPFYSSTFIFISMFSFVLFNNFLGLFPYIFTSTSTPTILMPFMVLIETISNIIRPGTLAVRLTANMIAGHLLMTLLSSTGPNLSYMFIFMLIIIQIMLLVLESAVAIIQSYVIAILSTLYSSEVMLLQF